LRICVQQEVLMQRAAENILMRILYAGTENIFENSL
jgi:hypothetical protein